MSQFTIDEAPTNRNIDVASFRRRLYTPSRARVLLAEDDRDMRDMIAACLREDGYEVVVANDGGELLVRLATAFITGDAKETHDVIVSDIRMPVCSGLQVLEGIRRANWTTPVLLMTAFGDDETRARVEKQGGVLFDKPFDLDDLRTAVLHLVHGHAMSGAPRTTPRSLIGDDPILALVATTDSTIDAWSIKWTLQAEGVQAYLGGRAMSTSAEAIDVYVLSNDAQRARAIIDRLRRREQN